MGLLDSMTDTVQRETETVCRDPDRASKRLQIPAILNHECGPAHKRMAFELVSDVQQPQYRVGRLDEYGLGKPATRALLLVRTPRASSFLRQPPVVQSLSTSVIWAALVLFQAHLSIQSRCCSGQQSWVVHPDESCWFSLVPQVVQESKELKRSWL